MVTRRKTVEVGGRSWVVVSLVVLLLLPVAAYGQAAGKADWEVEWEKTVAAAKKEGKVIAEVSSDFIRNYRPLVQSRKDLSYSAKEKILSRNGKSFYNLMS